MINNQINTFLKVVDAGSFTKAAELMYITPTSVIKQISNLEARMQITLFERTHRGLVLTEAGKSLAVDAKEIVRLSQSAVQRAQEKMYTNGNVIRVGTSPLTPSGFLADFREILQKEAPEIQFKLVPIKNNPSSFYEMLNNFGKDVDCLGGLLDDDYVHQKNCAGIVLHHEPIRCAVSLNSELAKKKILNISDFNSKNVLLAEEGCFSSMDKVRKELKTNCPEAQIHDFIHYSLELFNRCSNTDDILIATDLWKEVHPLLKIMPVEWDYTLSYGIMYSKNPTPVMAKFIKILEKYNPKRQ